MSQSEGAFTVKGGFDLRLCGDQWAAWRATQDVPARLSHVAASFDISVQPPLCAPEAQADTGETALPNDFWDECAFYPTFRVFRSDLDAVSCLADPAPVGIALYTYRFHRSSPPSTEDESGWLAAIAQAGVARPSLRYRALGTEILDRDWVSVSHAYADDLASSFHSAEGPIAERLAALEATTGLSNLVAVEIAVATDPYWFPEV